MPADHGPSCAASLLVKSPTAHTREKRFGAPPMAPQRSSLAKPSAAFVSNLVGLGPGDPNDHSAPIPAFHCICASAEASGCGRTFLMQQLCNDCGCLAVSAPISESQNYSYPLVS